jgi:hypothetical protein
VRGRFEGCAVGIQVGLAVGIQVGFAVGIRVGFAVGIRVGFAVGVGVGHWDTEATCQFRVRSNCNKVTATVGDKRGNRFTAKESSILEATLQMNEIQPV